MTDPKRYVANPVVSCREEEDVGVLLYNPDTDTPALLNPTGRVIWDLLAEPRDLDEIAAHLTAFFQGVTLPRARQDAADFIGKLAPDFILEAGHD